VFLWTAPAALGVPCRLGGEATCQCAKLPIALSGSCSVASPAKRRLGALLSCVGFWMVRVEGNGAKERWGVRGQGGGVMLMGGSRVIVGASVQVGVSEGQSRLSGCETQIWQ
jgi:hypothetical protein